jgi:beta-glucosidase
MRDCPTGLLWGAAVAAHQVEGGNTGNDWWGWEHDPTSPCVEPSRDAIDQRHRYAEDVTLRAGLGLNAYRLSLEWFRIEPSTGDFSRAEIEQNRRVLGTVQQAGLTPVKGHRCAPRFPLMLVAPAHGGLVCSPGCRLQGWRAGVRDR